MLSTLYQLKIRKIQHTRLRDIILTAQMENNNNISDNYIKNITDCGSMVSVDNMGRITSANFCRNRFCPICQWRNSRKSFGKLMKIQTVLNNNYDFKYIFITFTIENTKDLGNAINQMMLACKRMQDDARFKRAVKGFIRSFEVTYNKERDDYHPHIHWLCAVGNDYFDNEKNYLTHSYLLKKWSKYMELDYLAGCHVEAVDNAEKSIAEVSKYVIKPIEIKFDELDDNVLYYIMTTLYKRRLHSLGGIYSKIARTLNIKLDTFNDLESTVQSDFTHDILYTYDSENGKYNAYRLQQK